MDLRGNRKVKDDKDLKKKNEAEDSENKNHDNNEGEFNVIDECIGETSNWQEKYWKRESNENYKKLCKEYEKDPQKFTVLGKHPKDL